MRTNTLSALWIATVGLLMASEIFSSGLLADVKSNDGLTIDLNVKRLLAVSGERALRGNTNSQFNGLLQVSVQ